MAAVSFAVMWLALAVLCAFLARYGCGTAPKSGAQAGPALPCLTAALPLPVLCGVVLVLCAAGCLGQLRAGMLLVLALALAAAAVLAAGGLRAARQKKAAAFWREVLRPFGEPGWLLALGGGAVLALVLAVRQPLFTQWDEFSFWGTAARVVKEHDALYTLAEQTNLTARSYPPALAVLGYAFSFLSPRFLPWLTLAAYGMLYFCTFGAILAVLPRRTVGCAAFGALALVLAPFAVECWYDRQPLMAYATAYADLMLGLLTAGGCAVWFAARADGVPLRGRALAGVLAAAACVTAALGLTKDVGLPLGLVVMLVCTMDHAAMDFAKNKKDARALARLACVALVLLAAAAAAYFGWALHLKTALGQDRSQTGGSAQLSTVGMLVSGLKALLGIERSEKFSAVFRAMLTAFFGRRVSVFGSGLRTAAFLALVLAAAFWLAPRGGRRRVVCYAAASGLGFIGYYFFQLLCYVYVFSDADGRGLASYPRYMSSYYLFWLLGALCMLLWAVRGGRRAAGVTVLGLAAALLALCAVHIRPEDTVFARSASFWDSQTLIEERAGQAKAAAADDGERVLLVSQWDDGARWYRYAYALEPLALYHAVGDNTIVPPQVETQETYPLRLSAESIGGFLRENGCTLLLLDVDDDDFRREFGTLFTDGMAGYDTGECVVYRVEYTDGGYGVCFVPCREAAQ